MIENVKCPVFFIHGEKDNIIKYKHTIELYNLVPLEYRYKKMYYKFFLYLKKKE